MIEERWQLANMEPVLGTFEHQGIVDDNEFDESKLPSSGYEYLRRVQ